MNLAIDIGNSRIKWARFKEKEIVDYGITPESDMQSLRVFIESFETHSVTMSSVVHLDSEFLKYCQTKNVLLVNSATPIPLKNNYASPSTLGIDRLCAAIGAKSLYPKNPVLAIDIGTCIKYEFVSSDSIYEGGNIAPGLRMRFSSLNNYTAKLPALEPEKVTGPIGKTTNDALRLGVQQGMLFEIEAMIQTMEALHPNLKTVGTGGDLPFFANDFKTHIFADSLLVLRGINEIYIHNS